MTGDDELARLLPEPPPPRPGRRDTTIADAMRRFDGIAEPTTRAAPERERAGSSGWMGIGRGQVAAFASILLVALISIPVALRTPGGPIAPDGRSAAPAPERHEMRAPAQVAVPDPVPPRQPICKGGNCAREGNGSALPPSQAPAAEAALNSQAAPGMVATNRVADARETVAASAGTTFHPPAPPPPPAAKMAAATAAPAAPIAEIVVTGSRQVARASQNAPVAITATDVASFEDRAEVVVTATRSRQAKAASRRGDWNACTVVDPEQSLRGCKRLIDPAAKGPAGVAASRLSQGLTQAWRGEWDAAIAAFDEAIALRPRLATAYLNRGLAHQRTGELEKAAADLDLAVRYAPGAPRGFYHRSVLRKERGDLRGAKADAARAAYLDPRYDAVVE